MAMNKELIYRGAQTSSSQFRGQSQRNFEIKKIKRPKTVSDHPDAFETRQPAQFPGQAESAADIFPSESYKRWKRVSENVTQATTDDAIRATFLSTATPTSTFEDESPKSGTTFRRRSFGRHGRRAADVDRRQGQPQPGVEGQDRQEGGRQPTDGGESKFFLS